MLRVIGVLVLIGALGVFFYLAYLAGVKIFSDKKKSSFPVEEKVSEAKQEEKPIE